MHIKIGSPYPLSTSLYLLPHFGTYACCLRPADGINRSHGFRKENRCRSRKARKDEGGVSSHTPHRDRPKPDAEMQRCCAAKSAGGSREGDTPGLIPNPAVKPLSADGTAASGRGRVGHRRLLYRSPHPLLSAVGRSLFYPPPSGMSCSVTESKACIESTSRLARSNTWR